MNYHAVLKYLLDVKIILYESEILLFYTYNNFMEISALMMIMNAAFYVPNFVAFQFHFFSNIINTFSYFRCFIGFLSHLPMLSRKHIFDDAEMICEL